MLVSAILGSIDLFGVNPFLSLYSPTQFISKFQFNFFPISNFQFRFMIYNHEHLRLKNCKSLLAYDVNKGGILRPPSNIAWHEESFRLLLMVNSSLHRHCTRLRWKNWGKKWMRRTNISRIFRAKWNIYKKKGTTPCVRYLLDFVRCVIDICGFDRWSEFWSNLGTNDI